jgi:hypothetical protein
MKTLQLSATSLTVLATLLLASPVRAVEPVNYNAGPYVGTMKIITADAFDSFVRTTSTLQLKGRSDGSDTLRLVGTPQHAMPAVGQSDDFPMKVFLLGRVGVSQNAALGEYSSMDTDSNGFINNTALSAQTVTKNAINARLSYQRYFGGVTFNVTVIIQLSRLKQ